MRKIAYINGKIYTANECNKWADTLITIGNKIYFAGKKTECEENLNECDQIIDLNGKLMLPGFIDCHTHFVVGGFSLLNIDYTEVTSKYEFIELTKKFKQEFSGKWILGGNWNNDMFDIIELPHRNWVDEFSKDIPIFVTRSDLHMGLANSRALELAGINEKTENPEGGIIVRDSDGKPTGILKDNAMKLIYKILEEPTAEDYKSAVERALKFANSNGVTSVHDIIFNKGSNGFRVYQSHQNLTCRINLIFPLGKLEEFKSLGISSGFGNEYLKIGALKSFADGSLGSNTAWFFDDYKDAENEYGLPMEELKNGELKRQAIEADLNKNQLIIHAIGDRAVSEVIDIIEEIVNVNPKWDRRPRIEHLQHIKEKDLKRICENGIIASVQPQHLHDDGVWIKNKIKTENLKDAFRIKSLLDNNIKLAFGSDWTVAPLDPLKGIFSAATRRLKNPQLESFNYEEIISVEEAVKAYTINAAYSSFEEEIKGSIETGKLADFVVLNEDIFKIDPLKIKDVKVDLTVMDGNVVYKNSDAEGVIN